MAEFTVAIHDLVYEGFDFQMDEYPIFDESYRDGLNTRIIQHYYYYEIGQESRDQFRYFLKTRLNEVMPYYNKLYESEKMLHDPMHTMSYEHVTDSQSSADTTNNVNNTVKSQNKSTSRARNVASDFPQTMLSGNGDYATNASDVASDADTNATATDATLATTGQAASGKVITKVSGRSGIAADILTAYRNALLNIDLMVIAELRDLFMFVSGSGSSYVEGGNGYGAYFGFGRYGF